MFFTRKVFILIVMVLLTTNAFSVMVMNDAQCTQDCDSPSTEAGTSRLSSAVACSKEMIIDAATAYMKAYRDYLEFALEFENSKCDLDKVQSAISNLETAELLYESILFSISQTGYNYTVIYRLIYYDYIGFEWKHKPNWYVFQEVKSCLNDGDSYRAFLIMKRKVAVAKECLRDLLSYPIKENAWKASQAFSNGQLFGQYCAMIFNDVK